MHQVTHGWNILDYHFTLVMISDGEYGVIGVYAVQCCMTTSLTGGGVTIVASMAPNSLVSRR